MSDLQCPARLFFARHAEAAYAEPGVLSDEGGWLTEAGLRQARELGARLRGERIAAVYTSPIRRAVQTAAEAAAALGLPGSVAVAGLEEFSVGAQTEQAVLDRVRVAVSDLADRHRGEALLVVSHGGVLTLALRRLAVNGRPGLALGRPLAHCATVRVEVDADGWRLLDPWPGRAG